MDTVIADREHVSAMTATWANLVKVVTLRILKSVGYATQRRYVPTIVLTQESAII